MKEHEKEMKLAKLDDLFTTQEERDYDKLEKVQTISIKDISDFPNHPFKVIDDENMQSLVESIKEKGVLLPTIVRKKEDGNFEMVSGHRRKRAAQKAGLQEIPCIVKELSDDEAVILMVDSNIQREEVLPSERAFAYKMKLEAEKHQGKKINTTSVQVEQKLEKTTREKIAKELGQSASSIQRFIRLTYLIPELLEQVDNKRIALNPAVELSYLTEEHQYVVLNKLEYDEVSPSLSQAIVLKQLEHEGDLTESKIEEVLDQLKANQKEHKEIKTTQIKKYFKAGTSEEEMINVIHKLLENYYHKWHDKNREER